MGDNPNAKKLRANDSKNASISEVSICKDPKAGKGGEPKSILHHKKKGK